MKKYVSLLLLLIGTFVGAQQPQAQQGQPIYSVNAKYTNGVAPGYWPTKGAGLTLNISAGTSNCANTIVEYAGGTLTMTNSTTNYVYLDTASSCAPGSNTSGFTATTIPLAKVVTSGGSISSIDDVRTMQSTAVGSSSPTGAAGGDLTGTYPNPGVGKINGGSVPASAGVLGSNSSSQPIAATATGVESPRLATSTGSANAYVLTLSPAITTYTGFCGEFISNFANTGAATIAINGLAAKNITKDGSTATALAANDIKNAQVVSLCYDGTQMEMHSPPGNPASAAGTAGGDLSGTYPNPTVAQVNGAVVPASANMASTNSSRQLIAGTAHNNSAILTCIAASASGTAYTCSTSPTFSPATGDRILFKADVANTGSATLNVNSSSAATIKKQGGGTNLVANDLLAGTWTELIYDGTNWQMNGQIGNTAAGGITSINGDSTAAQTIVGAGSANVASTGGVTTVTGANGAAAPRVNNLGATNSYTVQNSDNGGRDVFVRNGAISVTLPKINSISAAPFVATRVNQTVLSSCTSCTTASFSQSAANVLVVQIVALGSTNWPGVASVPTDSAGDTFAAIAPVATAGTGGGFSALATYYATGIAASGANTVTVHMVSTSDTITVSVIEYAAVNFDRGASTAGLDNTAQVATVNVTYPQEIMLGFAQGTGGAPATCSGAGWSVRIASGSLTTLCEQLVAGVSSNSFAFAPFGGGGNGYSIAQAGFSINSIPTFTSGWKVQLMNEGNNLITVTPTTSTIAGQTTLVIPPNTCYEIMSDGISDYSVNGCGGLPNLATNGVLGQDIQVVGFNRVGLSSDIGTTTMITTGAVDAFYSVDADVNCTTTTSTAVAPLVITYTDTSNTVQTSTVSATCTTLGAASIGSIRIAFRAKASTNIQYGVAHTGSQPTYDVSVAVYQKSTK